MILSLHRCKVCGTRWLLWPDINVPSVGETWNLLDGYQRPGSCCDNVPMGDQIEHLRDFDLASTLPETQGRAAPLLENESTVLAAAGAGADAAMVYFRDTQRELSSFEWANCATTIRFAVAAALRAASAAPAQPKDVDAKYHELLYAVEQKYPGESRHQTALRLIQRAQAGSTEARAACPGTRATGGEMKKFPNIIHCVYEEDTNGDDDYLVNFTDGVSSIEAGQRVAIYKLVDEGVVRGPKSFISKRKKASK